MEVRVKGSKLGIRYAIDHVKNRIKNGSKEKFDNSNDLQAHFFDRAMKDTDGNKALSYLASHVTKDYLKNDDWADIIRDEGIRQFMQMEMNYLEDNMRWAQDTQLDMMFNM